VDQEGGRITNQLDLAAVLDEGPWTQYQKLLVSGTALAIVLDGMDNQLLSNVIPALMTEWSLPRAAFTTVLALGPLGMIVGGSVGGMLGDRFGRRTALLSSVLAFAIPTLAIAGVNGIVTLGLFRFLAGLGLGGAMPNAAALAAEYVPRRHRPFAITLTIVCVPLGGTLAALLAGQVLPRYGWRALFLIGGLMPVVVALLLLKLLPESPHYLLMRRERWSELIALLVRLGHDVRPGVTFVDPAPSLGSRSRVSIRELFSPALRRETLGLSGAFFFCLLANYVGFNWIVAMLTAAGFAQVAASSALAAFNFGGVASALAGGFMMQRIGSRLTLMGMSATAVASAIVMTAMPLRPPMTSGLIAMFALTGGLLNAVQTTMYALAAHVYPTAIRGTGVGTAVAVGRIGNVAASYVGAFALDRGGARAFFGAWAVAMAIVLGSLALVRRHIERPPRARFKM
jgi:AAHS family 4-hydroxybenzoate transporter-like MFS transporter